MFFRQIPYLESVKRVLCDSVTSNHVAHAQLFYSGAGSAALPMAVAYFSYLNCLQPIQYDACGQCASCSKCAKLIHPDLHFVFPVTTTAKFAKSSDAVSQNFMPEFRKFFFSNPYAGIQTWTQFLENKQPSISREEARNITKLLSLKAFEARYKAVIIWLPEMMHPAAANALLKILEEPPPMTLFLLVSQSPELVMPTILSRTQKVQIPAYTDQEITAILIERYSASPQIAAQAAFLCQRDLSKAIDLLTDSNYGAMEFFQQWMRNCYKRDFGQLIETSEEFAQWPKQQQLALLEYGGHILREVLRSQNAPQLNRLRDKELEFVRKFGVTLNLSKIEGIANALQQSSYHLSRNANPKIEFSHLSLEIAEIFATD